MEYLIGIGAGLFVCVVFGRLVGLERDRAFYPTVLIVIASYYLLFAVMGGSMQALGAELAAMAVFVVAAVFGFKRGLWPVAVGLALHGVFDFFHADFIANPGVPVWWPGFCLGFDVVAGAYLGWLQRSSLWIR